MKAIGYSLLVLLASALVWAPAAQAEWSYDAEVNNLVCAALGDQNAVQVVGDGAGGYIAVWVDERGADSDIYAQRLDAAGGVSWNAAGVAVCTAAGDQTAPRVVCDGAGGAIVVWVDGRVDSSDVYAQRVDADGAVQWTTDGVVVSAAHGYQDGVALAADGFGGAYIAWEQRRSNPAEEDAYAQLVDASGALQWGAGGIALSDSTGAQGSVDIASDPGGAIFVWSDDRAPEGGIHAARTDASGVVLWSSDASLMLGGSLAWDDPVIMSDGWGGAFVTCEATRGFGELDILGQRVNVVGAPLWGVGGLILCDAGGDQYDVRMVTDNDGGVILAWSDERSASRSDVYAMRVDGWGTNLWPLYSTGLMVSGGTDGAASPDLVPDGAGGAVIAWHGGHTGYEDIYAQRVDAIGNIEWALGGEDVSSAFGQKWEPRIVTDGMGGGVVFWSDFRNTVSFDVYAQRIERNGYLGYPAPEITTVQDHPDDQGGEMMVSWTPSYLDVWPNDQVGYYTAWTRYAGTSRSARTAGLPWQLDTREAGALARQGWEYAGQVQAYQLSEYSLTVSTYGDSSGAGTVWTDVMVLAHSYIPDDSWASASAMGYSIDNWAPGVPGPLTAEDVAWDVELLWSPSRYRDEDLSHYDVHRSSVSGFIPDASTLIATSVDTFFTDQDPGQSTWYYRVVAEDVHGNESGPSEEASAAPGTGVDDSEIATVLTIRGNTPNPFNPLTTLEYDLPIGGHVRLDVFTASGDLIATIEDGFREAGRRQAVWDGTDAAGRQAPSGVYFAMIEAGEETAVHKMVLLK